MALLADFAGVSSLFAAGMIAFLASFDSGVAAAFLFFLFVFSAGDAERGEQGDSAERYSEGLDELHNSFLRVAVDTNNFLFIHEHLPIPVTQAAIRRQWTGGSLAINP
jgi:hypothetical protein